MTTATGRVRAPELRGSGGWINTDISLSLRDVRGRVMVLDFWTFCCINCLRVIEELRRLEERFGDRLVVVGVRSPKFPHESDNAAVEQQRIGSEPCHKFLGESPVGKRLANHFTADAHARTGSTSQACRSLAERGRASGACLLRRARGQSIRWPRATMIPSGPHTYAMRQMCSY